MIKLTYILHKIFDLSKSLLFMTEGFYSPPENYRVEFSAKSYDDHVYISFYSAVLICFPKRTYLKFSFCKKLGCCWSRVFTFDSRFI